MINAMELEKRWKGRSKTNSLPSFPFLQGYLIYRYFYYKYDYEYDHSVHWVNEFLERHNLARKIWENGWQKFLDHIYSTDQLEAMEIYLQEAYKDIYRLRSECPLLCDFWEECLKGLDRYSQKLHQRRTMKRMMEDDDTDGVQEEVMESKLSLANYWHKPLSVIATTILKGWSIVGKAVKAAVYFRIECTFCQIDQW